jgi:hypothetical protein
MPLAHMRPQPVLVEFVKEIPINKSAIPIDRSSDAIGNM